MTEPIARDLARPVTLKALTVSFASLAGYLVLRGMVTSADAISRTLFGTVEGAIGWIPWLGSKVKKKVETISHRISSWLGNVASYSDEQIGTAFHNLAHVVEDTAADIVQSAFLIGVLTFYVAKKYALPVIAGKQLHYGRAIGQLKKREKQAAHVTSGLATALDHPSRGRIGHAIEHARKSVATDVTGLRHWTLPRVKTLERELGRVRARERVLDREITVELPRSIGRTWKQVRRLNKRLAGLGAAALVATALGRLGLGWVRCSNVGRFGRQLCRTPWHFMNDLLSLLADFAVLASICQVLPWLEAGASEVAEPFIEALTFAGAGLCEAGVEPAAPLAVPTLHLPAAPATLTLHLP